MNTGKLQDLRKLMEVIGLDAYIIPSADPHQSEYIPDHWKARSWISGFTGSNGTVVVTKEVAGLWTDGRYFIQAEKQLAGSGIDLFKMNEPNVLNYPDWLNRMLNEGSSVGFDGRVMSVSKTKELEKKLKGKNIKLKKDVDLISLLWTDRPETPLTPIFIHDTKFAGQTIEDKLQDVRKEMKNKGVDYYIISTLDAIAWLYNIRGRDIPNNPVALSYAIVSEESALLFIDGRKIDDGIRKYLEDQGVLTIEYNDIVSYVRSIPVNSTIYFDPDKTNTMVHDALDDECNKKKGKDIITYLKAIKNTTEIENLINCQTKDGVALVKFLHWLDCNIDKEEITEISAADKLEFFRTQQEDFVEPSFQSITAYKDHAAMMHYNPTLEGQYLLKKEGMYLIDSGGQYLDGTTDITRTIVLGDITEEEMRDFTLTLKGHIALSKAIFLYGATGSNLDTIARQHLWTEKINYNCGTGHGVGFFLNVHEGPHNFSQLPNNTKLEKGMVITNEPGVYREGKHGVRIENTLLVIEDEKNEFGQFMKFKTISYCPIDLNGINVDLLTTEEKTWLNNYHQEVNKVLSPYLDGEEKAWLDRKTMKI
ncbi:aminopeptidase P family protein [Alkaliphilus peptidifermentans]|uniref:Xaa-Pro aminopeptidase n=1 Tax=Alkaliphilus peptidifermentans DSM 18978 TaxID=1120976 RepID=A0A1G5CEA5_9FIRM|nr:aminopeptidase P family protein [Alkaliphilus peptidifermentans]SCY00753.1 Xaa-Pro aminopeptidase [Alkaliphilus peptidifermentans DSM 18978]